MLAVLPACDRRLTIINLKLISILGSDYESILWCDFCMQIQIAPNATNVRRILEEPVDGRDVKSFKKELEKSLGIKTTEKRISKTPF